MPWPGGWPCTPSAEASVNTGSAPEQDGLRAPPGRRRARQCRDVDEEEAGTGSGIARPSRRANRDRYRTRAGRGDGGVRAACLEWLAQALIDLLLEQRRKSNGAISPSARARPSGVADPAVTSRSPASAVCRWTG
jgi:hypothetical protein